MDNLTKEFLAESAEGLDRMEQCLTALESQPDDSALLGDLFRCVHTIKGTTGFLGFSRLEKLAHTGEHLLSALRDKRLAVSTPIITALLQLEDGLRAVLQLIAASGAEGESTPDEEELMALLASLTPEDPAKSAKRITRVPVPEPKLDENAPVSQAAPLNGSSGAVNDRTLRIDVEVLNRMMNLVGDLVLTRNQLLQSHVDAENFSLLARRLDSITADLRETVMQARMQPLGNLFGKFPRMVRDLARSCGKKVRIEFVGQETGLDKSLLEAIKDPLTHAVRNSVDHGIEAAGVRLLAGKAAEGLLTLRASHQSGSVIIDVEDDGAGISLPRVIAKAIERGLLSEEAAAVISEREAMQLIFLPGFSTAAAVTTVSGRGVGMDVVRSNVEKVGGSVEVESRCGIGTRLRIRVPLTLAIVPALIVQSGGQSFCLPQGALAELVYVPRREAAQSIERIGDAQLYRLRNTLLPTIWLDELLGLGVEERGRQEHGFYLAVLEAEGCRYGLILDELMAPEEIVVKPLSAVLRDIGLFSGATVLGNGTLALILDVPAMAARAKIRPVSEEMVKVADPVSARIADTSFLVFQNNRRAEQSERTALPLASVERIETVPVQEIQVVNGQAFLQYRGELLPLEDPANLMAEADPANAKAKLTVLICRRPAAAHSAFPNVDQRAAMIVREVLDVADGQILAENPNVFEGRLALVRNRLTVVKSSANSVAPLLEVA